MSSLSFETNFLVFKNPPNIGLVDFLSQKIEKKKAGRAQPNVASRPAVWRHHTLVCVGEWTGGNFVGGRAFAWCRKATPTEGSPTKFPKSNLDINLYKKIRNLTSYYFCILLKTLGFLPWVIPSLILLWFLRHPQFDKSAYLFL